MANRMDEIKQKIMGLINKQPPKIPSMGFDDANYHFPQVPTLSINSKTVTDVNRPADQDILESIEAAYFSMKEEFDICRFELEKLPEILDCDQIQRDFKNLKQQHQVVSKKVLQLILEHQNGCNSEFEKVAEILAQVKRTLELCRTSRKELKIAGKQFSASLGILANYRKRILAQNLLNNLNMIKNLHSFDRRCQQMLNDEDYAGAIMELKKCQKTAVKYRHFSCVAALTYKLQETLENTDAQLDRVLAQMCFHFDGDRYSKLQVAYNLLEKSQVSMIDNLHVHYITAIYNSSFNVVHSYVTSADILDSTENTGKNPYKTLCQSIGQNVFIPCLVHLCKVLFKIVLSYHQLVRWHYNLENDPQSEPTNLDVENTISKQKLEHYLSKIWDDVQRKVSSLLLNADLASYKFDQFVQVLRVVHRLIQVGEEFCSSKSEDLQESIRKQSVNYFKNYHAQRMDELKIFLENEMWEVCPVKPSFDILQLQEFKPFRSSLKNFKLNPQVSPTLPNYSTNSTECCSSSHSQDGSSIIGNYFIRYADHGTPFDTGLDNTVIEEDILVSENEASGYFSEDSEEESEELRRDYVDEYADDINSSIKHSIKDKKEKHHHKAPILTNTTLSVLRQMGKYIQMSRLLKPIAYQIISCMNQLFDYYLYSVHLFFARDLAVSSSSLYTKELNIALKKISDNLVEMKVRGLSAVLMLICIGQIKCGAKESVAFSQCQIIPITLYGCEETESRFEYSGVLRNINDNGDKVLDFDIIIDEPLTPGFEVALKIDQWDNGDWKEDFYNGRGNLCEYLDRFAKRAWEKARINVVPPIEQECGAPEESYTLRNFTVSPSDFAIPAADHGTFRILIILFDEEGEVTFCYNMEAESNRT